MDLIIVTDWEVVSEDDFYLSDEWVAENMKQAKELAKNKDLYIGYEVGAKNYLMYKDMDATQVLIDSQGNVIINCETQVISNNHEQIFDLDS